MQRPYGIEDLCLFRMNGAEMLPRRRLHRQQCDYLEEVILDHVAQAARRLIECTACSNAESLAHGDLHAGYVIAIPDRLQERIGESEIENIHDRFLAQEVIDAEDRVLREHRFRGTVQRTC